MKAGLFLFLGLSLSIAGPSVGRALTNASSPSSEVRRVPPVHDPSSIAECDSTYWFYSTGRGIVSRYSTNLVDWQTGPPVFKEAPQWTTNAVPLNRGHLWAPDLIRIAGRYYLYHSVSSWGSTVSAIGLATNATLNPSDPRYGWVDQGPVVLTSKEDNYNAIDPSVMLDREERLWMAFGSYWSGVKLVELDPHTGHRIATNSPMHPLAWNDSIEAACLMSRNDYYYLFVNWGQCCRGTNSTYEIRVGRSKEVTGPYIDKDGKDLMQRGGTLFLGTDGRYIGPGHATLLHAKGTDYVSYHFYDREHNGRSAHGIRVLRWDKDGWPEPGEPLGELSPSHPRTPNPISR